MGIKSANNEHISVHQEGQCSIGGHRVNFYKTTITNLLLVMVRLNLSFLGITRVSLIEAYFNILE